MACCVGKLAVVVGRDVLPKATFVVSFAVMASRKGSEGGDTSLEEIRDVLEWGMHQARIQSHLWRVGIYKCEIKKGRI